MKKILLAALFLMPEQILAIEDGVDLSFRAETIAKSNGFASVRSVFTLPDGKVFVGGDFTSVASVARSRLARLNSTGTLDISFDPSPNSTVNVITVQPDGKVLIGGDFTTVGGVGRRGIARLNTDGSVDTNFNPVLSSPGVKSIVLQDDGRILIGGDFVEIDGQARALFARLNADGTLDTTFNTGLNAVGFGRSISLQGDGKVLVGGSFFSTSRDHFARLNSDGSLDTSFNANLSFFGDEVTSIAIEAEGKILISGRLTIGGQWKRVARLEGDGSADSGFAGNVSGNVASLAIQPDNKILIGGDFDEVDGVGRRVLARLNQDGTLDETFDPEISDKVFDIEIRDDNKILIAGEGRNKIVRFGRNMNVEEAEELCVPVKASSGSLAVICL